MAIAYVSSAQTVSVGTGTSLTVNVSSFSPGITNGNLLIALVSVNNTATSFTLSGWTEIANSKNYGTTSFCAYYKVANNESGSYTASWTGGTFVGAFQILQYSGTDIQSPVDASSWKAITSSAGVYTTNSATASMNNELVLSVHHEKYSPAGFTWTPPTNSTKRLEGDMSITPGTFAGSAIACEHIVSGSFSGTKSASTTNTGASNGAAYILLIKPTGVTFEQTHFMFYNDDASINSATALSGSTLAASLDTDFHDIDLTSNSKFRIRMQTANVGVLPGDITRRLEFKEDSGEWTQITTNSNNVRLALSSNFTDGDATSSRLTSTGTFTAGEGKESGSDTTQISLTNDYYTEDEWCVEFQTTASGHTYQFRVTNAGIALDQYDYTPSISPIVWVSIGSYLSIDVSDYSSPSFEVDVVLGTSDANYPAYSRLYNVTDSTVVTGSVIGVTSLTMAEYTSDITLTSNKKYVMQVGSANGGTVKYGRLDGSVSESL